jgi:hypothetical protein
MHTEEYFSIKKGNSFNACPMTQKLETVLLEKKIIDLYVEVSYVDTTRVAWWSVCLDYNYCEIHIHR